MTWNFSLPFFESKNVEVLKKGDVKFLGVFQLFSDLELIKHKQRRHKRRQHRALKQAESMAFSIITDYIKPNTIKLNMIERSIKKGVDIFLSHIDDIVEKKPSLACTDFQKFSDTVSELMLDEVVSWISICVVFGVAVRYSVHAGKDSSHINKYAGFVKLFLNTNRQLLNFVIRNGGWAQCRGDCLAQEPSWVLARAVYIILEYCEGGNLQQYIKTHNRLRERVCRRALQQLASGLAYIQSKNICHMDLKPQNILMNFDPFTMKIADFGLAQYVPEKNYMDNLRGSPLYMAPEILLRKKYNYNVDLWSIGIILYECLFGRAPLAHKNCSELLEALRAEVPIKYPSTIPISNDCKDLLNKLLVYNPNERITYNDFFDHPFIDLAHAPTEENKRKAFRIIQEAVLCDEKKEYSKAFNSYCQALRYLVPFLDTVTASEERAYFQLKVSEYLNRAEELKVVLYKEDTYRDKIEQHWSTEEQKANKEAAEVFTPESGKRGHKDIISLISSDSLPVRGEASSIRPSVSEKASLMTSNSDSDETKKCSSSSSHSTPDSFRITCSTASDESESSLFEEHSPQRLKDLFSAVPKAQDAIDIGYIGQMYMVQGDYETAFKKYESALSILIPLLKGFPPGFKRDLLVHQIRKWLAQAESAKTLASAKAIHCEERVKNGFEATENCSIQ